MFVTPYKLLHPPLPNYPFFITKLIISIIIFPKNAFKEYSYMLKIPISLIVINHDNIIENFYCH